MSGRHKLFLDSVYADVKMRAEKKGIQPLTKPQIKLVYDSIWSTLRDYIAKYRTYHITGFGEFARKTVPAHPGRNFKAEEPMEVPPTKTIHFSPSEDCKRYITENSPSK